MYKRQPYGVACAEKLGFGLASGGAAVVSGLAKGIDAAAIRGALRAGGVTVGVVGNGQMCIRDSLWADWGGKQPPGGG